MQDRREDTLPARDRFDSDAKRWGVAKVVAIYLSFGAVWMLVNAAWMGSGAGMVQQGLFILLSAGLVAVLVYHLREAPSAPAVSLLTSVNRSRERRRYPA